MFYNYPEEFLFQVVEKEYLDIISSRVYREYVEDEGITASSKSEILSYIDEEYIRSLDNNLILEEIE